MYIIYRQLPGGGRLYFESNSEDSPKWSTNKSKAQRFTTKQSGLDSADHSSLYELFSETV